MSAIGSRKSGKEAVVECKSTKHFTKTGEYLGREHYDTPSSIRGCNCPSCSKMRVLHKSGLTKHALSGKEESK